MKKLIVFLTIGLFSLSPTIIKSEESSQQPQQQTSVLVEHDKTTTSDLNQSDSASRLAYLLSINLSTLLITLMGISLTCEQYSFGHVMLGIGIPGFIFSSLALHEARQRVQASAETTQKKLQEDFNTLVIHAPDNT